MRFRSAPTVLPRRGRRSFARRFQRPGMVGRVLMTATMLGLAIALSTVGVIAHVDQQETTRRLALQREHNLQAIGVLVTPRAAGSARTTVAAASATPEATASERRAAR